MEVLKFPNPALFVKCKKVTVFGPELKILLDAMWETMKKYNGVGLAANQVGLAFRMFVMEGPAGNRIDLVNPYITASSKAPANVREGCLSAPGEFVVIGERAEWVQVTYEDATGEAQVAVFEGLYAVCVQHEIEHLEGKSFLENKTIPKAKRKELTKKWGIK